MIVFQLFWRLFGYQISVVVKRTANQNQAADDNDSSIASFMQYLDEAQKEPKRSGRRNTRE